MYAGPDKRVPAPGARSPRVTENARAPGHGARPARSQPPAACADRQLGFGARAAPPAVHRLREDGGAIAGGDDAAAATTSRTSSAIPDPAARLRSPRSRPSIAAGAEPARHRRCPRARRGARRRTRARPVPRRADRAQGQHRRDSSCRPLAARWPWSIIVRALDSRVAAGHEGRAGAVILGKANLDEFPFGDFGISTVGGTVGNAYDPSLSTAGIERRQRHGGGHQPCGGLASAPTPATRCRTPPASRRSPPSARRAG